MLEIFLSFIYHFLILSPGLIIIFLLVRYDKFPEPLNLLIVTVLLAFAGTTLFATIKYDILLVNEWFPDGDTFLSIDPETNYIIPESSNYLMYYLFHAIDAYVLVAFGEELVKYLVIIFFCVKLKELNEPLDGLIYGAMAGLGFALNEGFHYLRYALYAASDPETAEGGSYVIDTILGRFMAIPAHVFFGIIMGSFVSYAIFRNVNHRIYLFLAILVPTLLHGTYDYILFTDLDYLSNGVLYVALYAGMLAWVVGLYVHYHGLQRLKSSEPERRYNLIN
tara:strand:+ start:3261 stop:4097 length:837 start_codon:yes stop_codon:yes gene_type:complete